MTRLELAKAVTGARLSELETAVRFLWFRARFEGTRVSSPSEVAEFFRDQAIGHPNLARLRQRLKDDRRVLISTHGCELRLTAANKLDEAHDGQPEAARSPANGLVAGLLGHAEKIKAAQTRSFVMEAIDCVRGKSFRAAVLMSWCGALSLLQEYVFENHLAKFNADGVANGYFKKPVVALVDMRGAVKDSQFIEALGRISVLDDSGKRALKRCLDRRNDCGHPSEIRLGEAAVADHLETLMLNVFDRYGHT